MPFKDVLKTLRSQDYSPKPEEKGMDSGEKNETPRIISFTDDEKKAFQASNPGEDLACEVHGSLEEDGHFHVMSVAPLGKPAGDDQNAMAGQVMQKVMPG